MRFVRRIAGMYLFFSLCLLSSPVVSQPVSVHRPAEQNIDSLKTDSSSLLSLSTLDNIYRGRLLYADDTLLVIWSPESGTLPGGSRPALKAFKPDEITRLRFETSGNALLRVWPGALLGYAIGFSFVLSIGSNQNYNPGIGSAPIPHDQLIRTSLMGGFPTAVLGGLMNALINNLQARELYITPKIYKSILSDLKKRALFPDGLPSGTLSSGKGK